MINRVASQVLEATGSQGVPNDTPGALAQQLQELIRGERIRENFAEKYTCVESQNGYVQIPQTGRYMATSRNVEWFAGTDDHLVKAFTEGALSKLHKSMLKDVAVPWVVGNVPAYWGGPKQGGYKLTRLGREIVNCCRQYHEKWGIAYVNHVFSPLITVMLRAMKRYAVRVGREALGIDRFPPTSELAELLNRLTRFVRRACGSWRFINSEHKHRKQAQENFASARDFICHMAAKHSRLLIIRIDLYYRPYHNAGIANREIRSFLRWIRGRACKRSLLPSYLGFIIKRENGIVRGMHWHLMVICDGNLQRNSGYLAGMLGEAWAKRSGQGRGSYYNCYADREKYEFDGLDMLNLDDFEKMAGLRIALHYMTKQDCVLKATNDKVKNFWRSTVRVGQGKKRGKPRMKDDGLKLLKRMLGGKRSKYPPGFNLT